MTSVKRAKTSASSVHSLEATLTHGETPPTGKKSSNKFLLLRGAALFTTIASGFSGLVYEVTWHKQLSTIVGSEARATAIILAIFLGGLALGYEIFGRISRRVSQQRNVQILGYSELAIGAWAFVFDDLFKLFLSGSAGIPLGGPEAMIVEILVGCVLMLVPTTLMGGTLPLLTQGMSRGLEDAPKFHAQVYALNTFGAFFGCLSAGFFLLPAYGLGLTLLFMGVVNSCVGIALLVIAQRMKVLEVVKTHPVETPESEKSLETASHPTEQNHTLSTRRSLLISFLSGFYSICLQTVLIRTTGLAMGASEYAFSMVVSLYIGTLAIGAMAVSKRTPQASKELLRNQIYMLMGGFFVYATVPYWGYGHHLIRIVFGHSKISFYVYFLSCFLVIGSIVYLMLSRMGRTLPLLFAASHLKKDKLGRYVGTLYGINTFGCVMGALVGGYLLLFLIDLDRIFQIALLTMVFSAYLSWKEQKSRKNITFLLVFSAITLALPQWNKNQIGFGLFRVSHENPRSYSGKDHYYQSSISDGKLLAYKDAPSGTISIYEWTRPDATPESTHKIDPQNNKIQDPTPELGKEKKYKKTLSLFVNGKSDGSTDGDYATTILLAHLPGLFHQNLNGETAVIGFGTGITVGGLTSYPEIKNIDCLEISSSVRAFADLFSPYNWAAASNPKVQWIIADAYRHLTTTSKKYDFIISEPSNPWVTGVEKLYTLEFYQAVKNRLNPGGIYAQWFHSYSMSLSTLGLILNTYHSIFPYVYTFTTSGDIILIGSLQKIGETHFDLAEQRLKNTPTIAESLKKINMTSLADILALEKWNPPAFYGESGLHTLDFPKLSYAAGRDFFENAVVQIGATIDTPPALPWVHDYSTSSLFSAFYSNKSDITENALADQIKTFCRVKSLEDIPVPSLLSFDQPCRSLAFKGVKAGLLKSTLLAKDHPLLDVIETYSPTSWTSTKGQRYALAFRLLHNPINPIPLEDLKLKTSACYKQGGENLNCILQHVLALASSGFEEEGEKAIHPFKEKIKEELGPPALAQWEEVLSQARRLRRFKEGQGEPTH